MNQLAESFWNLRGDFRIAGVLNIGTHMSLARRSNGRFVVIDGCALQDQPRSQLMALTSNGKLVDAVVHVHPFHTLHVEATHQLFPKATLYGTARHREMAPGLPWADKPVETWGAKHPLDDVFELTVPDGVLFVCPDERVHVASVLVRHRETGIVHVDDTFNVLAAPGKLGDLLPQSSLRMHPMLGKALKPEAGAADAYATWACKLAKRWADTRIVCTAHSAVRRFEPGAFEREVREALDKVAGTLSRHRDRFG